jgi:hypothetical protein
MLSFPMHWSSRPFSNACTASIRAMRVHGPYLEVSICQPIKSRLLKADGTPQPGSSHQLNGMIGIEQFYKLALEMVEADPMVAVGAFHAATRHALDAALHPPKPPEPKSVRMISLKPKLPVNAPQTGTTAPT